MRSDGASVNSSGVLLRRSLFLRDSRRVFGASRREVLAYRSNEF